MSIDDAIEMRSTLEQEIAEVGKCLTEIYSAIEQLGSLMEDLSKRMALVEGDRLKATEMVSKILLPN